MRQIKLYSGANTNYDSTTHKYKYYYEVAKRNNNGRPTMGGCSDEECEVGEVLRVDGKIRVVLNKSLCEY